MYVFGEVQDPLEDTVELVEDIVQSQLCEILAQAASHALKRGTRFINVEDLIFLIRKDTQKVNRLKIFLSWKDVRKAQGKDSSGGADTAEDLLEEGADKPLKVKRMKIKFSWDLIQQYSSLLSDDEDEDEDEEELEAYEDQIQRLKTADDVTKTMSKDQYIYYADCRQASFTFKKVKKFREFCMMSNYCENRTNNEVMDVLGFLAYELVSKLTEVGLHVRKEWAQSKPADGDGPRIPDLFAGPPPEISPLQPVHIQEAFRRLQRPSKCMDSFRSGLQRTMVSLI
ncbi:transcription initiation factor IID, 18kD subunit-domain-containing protein [Polychytrium aggregatum]|uniref:transcription initiation factor IID, 18kD subunit-domain-containing protein n=1 Tax=Polychytrium aggregatum TaxID=110093 RepID=UPI0022FEA23E|nr:transcription initiation factor IID, 18kD subunit-domain-containing protein [Polychytrium aggregatum]KAI9208187.1 transcription initiation factor IID, 18kD subunit-domain-containing protein [Polychytrium aggregatum]